MVDGDAAVERKTTGRLLRRSFIWKQCRSCDIRQGALQSAVMGYTPRGCHTAALVKKNGFTPILAAGSHLFPLRPGNKLKETSLLALFYLSYSFSPANVQMAQIFSRRRRNCQSYLFHRHVNTSQWILLCFRNRVQISPTESAVNEP